MNNYDKYVDERFDDIEARIRTLESHLVSLIRKVYDLSPEVSVYFQDEENEDGQQERTAENILDEMDANISDFMDMVEATDRGE